MTAKRLNAICVALVVGCVTILTAQFIAAHVVTVAHREGLMLTQVK